MTDGNVTTPFARVVCFFANHIARPDYDTLTWHCDRCGSSGPKLWMTANWFVKDLRLRWRYRRWAS